jgi:hypothetical protein
VVTPRFQNGSRTRISNNGFINKIDGLYGSNPNLG